MFIDALYRAFEQEQEPTDLTIGEVLVDFVPLSKLMGESMTALEHAGDALFSAEVHEASSVIDAGGPRALALVGGVRNVQRKGETAGGCHDFASELHGFVVMIHGADAAVPLERDLRERIAGIRAPADLQREFGPGRITAQSEAVAFGVEFELAGAGAPCGDLSAKCNRSTNAAISRMNALFCSEVIGGWLSGAGLSSARTGTASSSRVKTSEVRFMAALV